VDKNEYKVKSEKLLELMDRGAFSKAANLADSIDWNKVRNISMLSSVSEVYEKNNELEKSYRVLNIAYQRSDGSRKIIYRLCSLALKTGNLDEALDFYDDFMEIAPKDPNQYLLRYQILRARKAPVEQQIEALEDYKKEEFVEEWAYELAKLYDEAGMTAECISECDEIMLWFSEGKFVYQAVELKKKYKPLTATQQEKYDRGFGNLQSERSILPKGNILEKLEERPEGVTGKGKDNKGASDLKILTPELEKILPFPDKPIGIQDEPASLKKDDGLQPKEGIQLPGEHQKALGNISADADEEKSKIGKTMDLGDALQSLLDEERANSVEEEEEYVLDTGSMEESIIAIEELADLPLTESYGKGEVSPVRQIEGELSVDDILQSMTDFSSEGSRIIEAMESDVFERREARSSQMQEVSALDPEIQRMIDEIEGLETPSHSVEDVAAKGLINKIMEEGGEEKRKLRETSDEVRLPKKPEKEVDEIRFHEEYEEDSPTVFEEEESKPEVSIEPEKSLEFEESTKPKESIEVEESLEPEVSIEPTESSQEIEEVNQEEVMLPEKEELSLEEAKDLEESLFEDSATSANKFIQEEFKLQGSHQEEEDERFIKREKKKRRRPAKQGAPSRTTAPLSRKETAKLHATGKTAPLPTGEISDAISLQDSGYLVQGRYDLESQSGKGIRAGLTEEQKKLFSYFVPVRGMSEQLVDVLEQDKNTNRGGTSRTGNLLIIGQKGSGKTVLAVDVVKAIQRQRNVRQGKVAILTGDALNKKKIHDIVGKLYGGALIIEKAGKMNEKTLARLNKALEQETGELLVVLEDQRKPLDRMLSMNREFKKKFTSRLEVPVFINDELVTFGQAYAQENGYRIDEMGILALYSKIDAKQREDHAVTVAEVKGMMDEAIDHSQRASAGKLVKRVLGKNTDDADRIILSEKDFTE
jgi:tetratricopeptide (TPR) repeat protein